MDRRMVSVGAIPLAEDWLQPQQDAMVALGALAQALFGGETAVLGLEVAPTQPATLAVTVAPGSIYTMGPLEPMPFGVLPADATPIIKQGLARTSLSLPVTPPPTAGYSRAYLVQAGFAEEDTDAVVLPYFNSGNPAMAFSGPGNNGQRQNTRRRGRVIVQIKAGAPSPTGTQVPPAADVGFIGLAIVTVANGAASVSQGAIQSLQSVPRPPSNMLRLRSGFSEIVVFSTPGSTMNWVVPAGVRRLRTRLWGGGGGGGGGSTGIYGSGSGGMGGGYCEAILDVTPGQVIPITVGAAGIGGLQGNNGGNGGTSSFGSICSATGGQGGGGGGGNNDGRSGGQGFGGSIMIAGGRGGSPNGWETPSALGQVYSGGEGGSSFGSVGPGRSFSYATPTNGLAANNTNAGAGGAGAPTAHGGNGAQGIVVVEY